MKAIITAIKVVIEKQSQDFDTVWVIIGDEGLGKSTLDLWATLLFYYFKQNPSLIQKCLDNIDEIYKLPDDPIVLINFCTQLNVFGKRIRDCDDESQITLDEAGEEITTDSYGSELNKTMRGTYTVIRGLRLFTRLILPSFFMLDPMFRKRRLKLLLYVHKRGAVRIYIKRQIRRINQIARQVDKVEETALMTVKPYAKDTFPDFKQHYPNIWAAYKAMKDKRMTQSRLKFFEATDKNKVSLHKGAKIMGISYDTAIKLKIEGKIKVDTNPITKRMYVTYDEIERFIKKNQQNA